MACSLIRDYLYYPKRNCIRVARNIWTPVLDASEYAPVSRQHIMLSRPYDDEVAGPEVAKWPPKARICAPRYLSLAPLMGKKGRYARNRKLDPRHHHCSCTLPFLKG